MFTCIIMSDARSKSGQIRKRKEKKRKLVCAATSGSRYDSIMKRVDGSVNAWVVKHSVCVALIYWPMRLRSNLAGSSSRLEATGRSF